ncbi:helix-turn-helix transcriptional regulator [Streptomyces sp. P01-B04]|uniref:TrmB family transcriptional regulator n=1 Tax=Streptomyces poriferorum TaxID=2798799 RepID=UPI001C5E3841|nr:helix-turn-helix domain-containing protein [Streptomyces poriferorum]MBW5250226.1 helix-turn-helix transcriptional regulator [Streptomyces poriferorum]MBW5259790.1 helix-turn-helix transcriptional regulator [Streptomyces poriferorum]
MLQSIGLPQDEERVYRVLVRLGSATAPEVALHLDLDARAVGGLLGSLESGGIVSRDVGRAGAYVVAPPRLAFGPALAAGRHALEQAESTVAALADEYRRGAAGQERAGLLEVVTGAEAIRHRFEQIQYGARHELHALVTVEPAVVREDENEAEEQATGRGVRYRVVLEQAALDRPSTTAELSAALGRTQLVRVVEQVPCKLVVADRSTALMPLLRRDSSSADEEPTSVVVRAPGVVEALLTLFEAVWNSARPLLLSASGEVEAEPQTEGPDETDLLLLSLMLTGLTDRAVAARLGLGLRTVQRRLQRLMEVAEVSTRMQLGWHAFERGWVRR